MAVASNQVEIPAKSGFNDLGSYDSHWEDRCVRTWKHKYIMSSILGVLSTSRSDRSRLVSLNAHEQ